MKNSRSNIVFFVYCTKMPFLLRILCIV